ncbi:hypothetical protein EMCRGX_G011732 [Ephydatia muelleri]
MLNQILQELTLLKGENAKQNASLAKLKHQQSKLQTTLDELALKSFSIEKSPYKDSLLKTVGTIFCNTPSRKPSSVEISAGIKEVMGEEADCLTKFKMAFTFCTSRLAELRAEERRRIFGIKPCEVYAAMPATQFVYKFLPVLKTTIEDARYYHHHVALLRKYCGTDPSVTRNNTYKGFQLWLETKFANGVPSLQELEAISNEDMPPTSDPAAVEYPASPLLQDSPLYLDDQVEQ